MRKITLALLILLSTQSFASKNLVEVYITQSGQLANNYCENSNSVLNNGIPAQTAMTSKYPVTYTYVNQSSLNIQGFAPYFDDGFSITSNNCSNTLPIGGVCTISGEYAPPALGNNRFRFWYKAGTNTFYCNAYTQSTQYLGDANIELSADSTPFNTYYTNPQTADNVYILKNIGTNVAVMGSVVSRNNPSQWIIDNCSGASLLPDGSCTITFGGVMTAGTYDFNIAANYNGTQFVYNETVVVGSDKKVMGCKIG